MPTINREELLHQLESVQPGLSPREVIEQSSCFVFHEGRIMTYNEEICCSQKTSLELTGAVKAAPLLALLQKLKEEEIELIQEEGEIIIKGKSRKAGIRREKEVLLPVKDVERPSDWKDLHEDWPDAIKLVHTCACRQANDQQGFALTCVNLTADFIEACDNFQVTRFKFKTGITQPALIKAESLKHLPPLGMTKFCETKTWVHFKNPAGLVFSCRKYIENFPDMTALLGVKGHPITIPPGLGEAAEKAAIFSAESSDDNKVLVQLRPEKLRIRGMGASGWFQEVKAIVYEGPELEFLIAPDLLVEITSRKKEALISDGRLKVNGGKWEYCTALSAVAEGDKE